MTTPTLAGTVLDRHFHVCALFDSRDEEYRILGPHYREGIEAGEKCFHVCDPEICNEHRDRLASEGVNVAASLERGQLEIASWHDIYLKDGYFDQDRMLGMLEETIARGKERGFAGTRLMGNMSWVFLSKPGTEQLIEYEARINDVLAKTRQPTICVYDVRRMSGKMMMDILRCHPLTLIGGVVHDNPYYTPPDRLLAELRERDGKRSHASA